MRRHCKERPHITLAAPFVGRPTVPGIEIKNKLWVLKRKWCKYRRNESSGSPLRQISPPRGHSEVMRAGWIVRIPVPILGFVYYITVNRLS